MNLSKIATRVAANFQHSSVQKIGGGDMVNLNSVTEVKSDEDGSLTFKVTGTAQGEKFNITVGISPEEAGSWDVLSGQIPNDMDADVMGEVFDHPTVKAAIAR